jgi:hypothetical protein
MEQNNRDDEIAEQVGPQTISKLSIVNANQRRRSNDTSEDIGFGTSWSGSSSGVIGQGAGRRIHAP